MDTPQQEMLQKKKKKSNITSAEDKVECPILEEFFQLNGFREDKGSEALEDLLIPLGFLL